MTDIQLRPYQQQFIADIKNEFCQNHRRVVGVAPCGAGKTIMTGWMIKQATERGKRSIFFVHRQELIKQTSETFTRLDIPHGIICAGAPMQLDLPVQIASVQTLALRLDKIPAPDFLICDECHHILAATYKKIIDKWSNAFLLGVTATPLRLGGITLNDAFDQMVLSLSVNELIKLGNLTPFRYFVPHTNIDLSKVKTSHGDFSNSELEKVMIDKSIIGDIVDNYTLYADGKSAICYCVNVNHSQTVADSFNAAGIPAAHVDADTKKILRAQLVDDFRQGKIKILCNAELFSEGFDVPACQAVILARPTLSLTLYIQQAMRPLRPDPNDTDKVAIIIDHVQNYLRHGLPNDFHNWSLDPTEKKKKKCPRCGKFITPISKPITKKKIVDGEEINVSEKRKFCPNCDYMFDKGEAPDTIGRKAINADGSITELSVDFDTVRDDTKKIISKPTTIEELQIIEKQKKYRRGWAAFQALNYVTSYDDCLHIANVCGYKSGWAWHKWQEIQSKISDYNILSNAQPV